jgi:hypothetical protein
MYLGEIVRRGVHWIQLAQDRGRVSSGSIVSD